MIENYYDVLECDEQATYEEIKSAYQGLVRKYHPDKNENKNTTEIFHKIDEAWKTLKEENLRKEYNLQLLNSRLSNQIHKYASLNREELDYDNVNNIYSYNCRCGGVYSIKSDELKETSLVSCDECSFFIEVVNK